MAGQILRRGERSFIVRIFVGRDATGTRKYLNRSVKGSKKDAQALLNKLLRDKDLGTLTEPSRMSLDSYLDHWLETAVKPRVRTRTYEDYKGLAKRYVRGPLGDRLLTQITPALLQGLYSDLLNRPLAPRTVRYCHTVLHNALSQAVKWRMLPQNPALYVDLPRKQHREMHAMTEAEAGRFLAAASSEEDHALLALLLTTGLRPSEALGLKWSDYDPRTGVLSVARVVTRPAGGGWKFEAPKTPRSRRSFEVPGGLVLLLEAHRAKPRDGRHGLMFPNVDGEPLFIQNLSSRVYKRVLKRAGLPDTFRLYDLRHTCATLLLLAGVHPKVVSDRLGHSSISETMDTYSHIIPGMQREASDRLDAMLFKAPTPLQPPVLN